MRNDVLDIRVSKTLASLAGAMQDLLEKKNFHRITVNDICKQAIVSRSTFYTYFDDKYRLMHYCLEQERQKLDEAVRSMALRDYVRMVLTTTYERRRILRNFLNAEADAELINMFKTFFHEHFSDLLAKNARGGAALAGSIPLLAAFYSGGLTNMIIWWIEDGCSVPIEEIAACQYNLLEGLWAL